MTDQLASSAPNIAGDGTLADSFSLALRASGRRPKTVQTYMMSLKYLERFAVERGMPAVTTLTAEHLREFFGWLYDRGCQTSTVSVHYRALQQYYRWLRSEGERQDTPLERIAPPRIEEKLQPHYTPSDIERVLKGMPASSRDWRILRNRAVVLTLFDTGLRGAELCGLRREDLSLAELGLKVAKGKGGKWREVAISAITAQAIDRYVRHRHDLSPWLFLANHGGALTTNGLKMMLERAWKAAGLTWRGVHCFRRGFAIQFLEAGGDPEDLRTLAGWSSSAMLRRYTKATETARARRAHAKFSPVQNLGLSR
jgi:integrase/recombinase XerD